MTLNELRAWAADNFVAATHQTMGQYRTALLRAIDQVLAAPSLPAGDGLTPEWIWNWLMDYCQRRAVSPATHDSLFQMVKDARAILAAPRQPGEVGAVVRPTDDELWDQTMAERDRYHEIADDLAAQIAAITGVEIGEHSSANDPWQNAMLAADDFIAAQLKKLLAGPAASAQQDEREAFNANECQKDVFEHGQSIGLFDIPKQTANAICEGISAATGAKVDWHYVGGRVHVKALPAAQQPQTAGGASLGFTISDGKDCGIRVLTWESGGCRPAEETECTMWDALAACQPQPSEQAQQVQADAGAVDIEPWRRARFGAFHEGKFVELGPDDAQHPAAGRARWIGGAHDYELLSHVLAARQPQPSEQAQQVQADADKSHLCVICGEPKAAHPSTGCPVEVETIHQPQTAGETAVIWFGRATAKAPWVELKDSEIEGAQGMGWEVIAARQPQPSEQAQQAQADARFFMDHGLWHDRVTGQHMYTQDQYDELRRNAFHNGYASRNEEIELAKHKGECVDKECQGCSQQVKTDAGAVADRVWAFIAYVAKPLHKNGAILREQAQALLDSRAAMSREQPQVGGGAQ